MFKHSNSQSQEHAHPTRMCNSHASKRSSNLVYVSVQQTVTLNVIDTSVQFILFSIQYPRHTTLQRVPALAGAVSWSLPKIPTLQWGGVRIVYPGCRRCVHPGVQQSDKPDTMWWPSGRYARTPFTYTTPCIVPKGNVKGYVWNSLRPYLYGRYRVARCPRVNDKLKKMSWNMNRPGLRSCSENTTYSILFLVINYTYTYVYRPNLSLNMDCSFVRIKN